MSSPAHAARPAAQPARSAYPDGRTLLTMARHLVTPLLMCLGLGLTYLGAFHNPEPHHLPVGIVGKTPQTQVLAQTIKDKAGDRLDVSTIPDKAAATVELEHRDLDGVFIPGRHHAKLLVAKAGSNSSATAVETVFRAVTDQQGVSLKVTDVVPPAKQDPNSSGLFFLLIVLSVGSYVSVLALGAFESQVGMRVRAALGVAVALAVSGIGIIVAGPVFHVVDHSYGAIWAMCLLYSAGIVAVGLGLHTFFKHLTPLVLMLMFVMINFTSSGGLFRPEMQNGFFSSLHAFWNGAGFVEGSRSILYFHHHDLGRSTLTLTLWLAAGVVLTAVAGIAERRRAQAVQAAAPVEPDQAVQPNQPQAVTTVTDLTALVEAEL